MSQKITLERFAVILLVGLLTGCAGEATDGETAGWAKATVTVAGKEYAVRNVSMELEFGEDGYYSIWADPVDESSVDCVPGLSGGLALYGPLPDSIRSEEDLAGKELEVEFSGDGDDANICFIGLGGLMGAEDATLSIHSSRDGRIQFSMAGSFTLYDGEGGYHRGGHRASAKGAAQITDIW